MGFRKLARKLRCDVSLWQSISYEKYRCGEKGIRKCEKLDKDDAIWKIAGEACQRVQVIVNQLIEKVSVWVSCLEEKLL